MLVRSPTFTNRLSSVIVNGSSPDSRMAGASSWVVAALLALDGGGDGGDVGRRGAAAAADQVHVAGLGELADDRGGLLGRLVVLAERVGQPGVGVAGDERVGDPRHLGDVGAHLLGAERAVEADRDRVDVPDRVPERLRHLAGQGAAGGVGDGAGDDDRPASAVLLEDRLDREDRGLGVEGVEDRLDEEQVRAAVEQAAGRLGVRRDQLVEAHVAGGRVVDVGRDRRRPGGRAERAGDVARPVRCDGDLVGDPAGQPRGLEVELERELLHAVVRQRDRGGVEGVGLDDVGAGLEVLAVDPGDDLGLGEGEQVVVALQVPGPVREPLAAVAGLGRTVPLDRRTHGTVDDQDPLPQGSGSASVASGRQSCSVTVPPLGGSACNDLVAG